MRRLGWLVAVTVILVAGCGGGSSTASTSTTTTGATGATTGGNTSTTSPSFSGSKNSKYCNLARQFLQTTSVNPSGDTKTAFQQFDALVAQYLAAVPSDIKADAETLVNDIKQLEVAVKAANYDFTKLKPADLAPLQDPKFAAASNRIDAYDSQVCGITTSTT